MDQSRRAVEAYWRSRMIEAATADEDKVAPVYKLEEICELLRSSHVSIVKEISEFVLKRLNHKSPIVKQKTLRLIKYCVGKSGVEFRREMQRHSAAMRQLFHYKGQVDPLKGDALNKAVRDTAHEAISAIFASEEDKPAPAENLNRRIEGFGSTNFVAPSEDKKSFLSDFVDIGSASLKLGFSSITSAHSSRKNDSGSYRGPVLRRSLTTEIDPPDRYERFDNHNEAGGSSSISKNVAGGTWGNESRINAMEMTNGESGSSHAATKSREERLLETIITSGGVRLQPSRDALQVFIVEASKLDSVTLSCALELKLQSHLWQVRMKAICVLEALLRKKSDAHFAIVASYFSENKDAVVKCSESPQASLREKAIKVLNFLNEEQTSGEMDLSEKSSAKPEKTSVVQMPDLIDTGDSDEYYGTEDAANKQFEPSVNLMTSTRPAIDDLFGDSSVTDIGTDGNQNDEDPFADVSFHPNVDKPQVDDIFSGLTVDDKQLDNNNSHLPTNTNKQELLDIFGTSFESMQESGVNKTGMQDLVGGFSDNEKSHNIKNPVVFAGSLPEATSDSTASLNNRVPNSSLNDLFSPQMTGMNQNPMFPLGPMQYNIPPNIMYNQALASQQVNYGAMGSFLAQQQLLATMSNFQHIGNQSAQANVGVHHLSGNLTDGALPDIFNPNVAVQTPNTMLNNTKKEETRAFDFISEHLSAVRDPKRVV